MKNKSYQESVSTEGSQTTLDPKSPESGSGQEVQKLSAAQQVIEELNRPPEDLAELKQRFNEVEEIYQKLKDSESELVARLKRPKRFDDKSMLGQKGDNNNHDQSSGVPLKPHERKLLRVQLQTIRNKIVEVKQILNDLRRQIEKAANKCKDDLRIENLKTKARSEDYFKRNKKRLITRLTGLIQDALKKEDERIVVLKLLEFLEGDYKEEFMSAFLAFVKKGDSELNLLLSGKKSNLESIMDDLSKVIINLHDTSETI